MKYKLFVNTLIPFVVVFNLFYTRQSQAKPSPIFEPIMGNIKTRLPSGLKMRLPASVATSTPNSTLYSFLPDDDSKLTIDLDDIKMDFFTVLIADRPNCSEQKNLEDCLVAAVGVTEDPIESQAELEALLADNEEDINVIKFDRGIEGFYFEEAELQLIVWRQNKMAHLLMSKKCPSDRICVSEQQLIDMAKSAAKEPAIASQSLNNTDANELN